MGRVLMVILCCFIGTTACKAQKWALRGSLGVIRSYTSLTITSMQSAETPPSITPEFKNGRRLLGKYREFIPLSGLTELTLIRTLSPKHSVSIDYLSINPYTTLKVQTNSNVGSSFSWAQWLPINIPTIKVNYYYTFYKAISTNPSSISVFSGITLAFKGREKSFGPNNGGYYYTTNFDSSGNTVNTYIYLESKKKSKPIIAPYLDLGINGSLRMGKRFKIGCELAAYVGFKTLYTEEWYGKVHDNYDAEFTFTTKLKPYFFTGQLFLQYRLQKLVQ